MASAVLDANVTIGLAKGDVFQHLAALYSPLYIPASVRQEVTAQGQRRPGVAELTRALGAWITEVSPDPTAVQPFAALPSPADREVLAVATLRNVDHILSGDRVVRREAAAQGIPCLVTSEVVVLFKKQQLIPAVKPVLDLARQRGFGIDDADYQQALKAAGE